MVVIAFLSTLLTFGAAYLILFSGILPPPSGEQLRRRAVALLGVAILLPIAWEIVRVSFGSASILLAALISVGSYLFLELRREPRPFVNFRRAGKVPVAERDRALARFRLPRDEEEVGDGR